MAYKNVYQFKITLMETSPVIWRRIQVSERYTFWDLHVAIQDSMGWTDSHLHAFRLINPGTGKTEEIGIPDDSGFSEQPVLPGWNEKIADWFSEKNNKAYYEYDFGDGWNHEIVLEEIVPKEEKKRYPLCLDGERSCPPEDCGGVWGYEDMLEVIKDPGHEEHESTMNWLGGKFDPDGFDCKKIKFTSPRKRLSDLFSD